MQILKQRRSTSRRVLIGTLIILTTMAMATPPKGWAMIAPAQVSDGVSATNGNRAADLKTIQTALESKMIRQRLTEFKLNQEQIDTRLSKLSDAQIHQTAMQIRTMNPAGDGGLDIVVTLLVIGILVALFMYVFRRV